MPTAAPRTGLRRVPWWAWVLLAIAIVIAVVAALGGFAPVRVTKVPTIALGGVYRGQQVDSRVLASRLVPAAANGERPPAGDTWLELELESTNTTDAPVPIDAISLRTIVGPLDGTTDPKVTMSARDGGFPADLQPGVPARLDLLWAVKQGSVATGDPIYVGVFEAVPDSGPQVVTGGYTLPEVKVRVITAVGRSA
jgi:hypothetical protein